MPTNLSPKSITKQPIISKCLIRVFLILGKMFVRNNIIVIEISSQCLIFGTTIWKKSNILKLVFFHKCILFLWNADLKKEINHSLELRISRTSACKRRPWPERFLICIVQSCVKHVTCVPRFFWFGRLSTCMLFKPKHRNEWDHAVFEKNLPAYVIYIYIF